MLISIIVPMYNAEKYIDCCLDSIVKQATAETEVIVVDDGSTDASPAIADGYAERYPFVKVIHQKNGGVMAARKTGAKHCTGEYIWGVDSDDWLAEGQLAGLVDEINRSHADVILTGYTDYKNGVETKAQQNIPTGFYDQEAIRKKVMPRLLSTGEFFTFGIYPTFWTSCVRRELLTEKINQMPKGFSLGEDIATIYPCILKARSLSVLKLTGYYYRVLDTSFSRAFNPKLAQENQQLFAYLNTVFPKDEVFARQYRDYIVHMSCTLVYQYIHSAKDKETFREATQYIREYLSNETVRWAFSGINILRGDISLKWKTVITLLRFRWFRLYWRLLK